MKGIHTLLIALASVSLVLQPAIGAALPSNAAVKASGTAVSGGSARSSTVPDNKASSAAKVTGSKATGTAVPSGNAGGKALGSAGNAASSSTNLTSVDTAEAGNSTVVKGDGKKLPDCSRDSYGGMSNEDIDKLWGGSGVEKYVDEW